MITSQSESAVLPFTHSIGDDVSPDDEAGVAALTGVLPDVPSTLGDVTGATVMIVDDEPVNIKAAEKHLRRIGYRNFVTVTDSLQALPLIDKRHPDLVLLDIMMPQVNGLELLRKIREDSCWQNLPVIILTAYCDPATKREALEAGATDFLAKPVEPHELAARVRNVLVAKTFSDQLAERAAQLECQVRRQTEQLVAARHQAELRYLAGKAEIATDVLHNVGNAMHSVNTSVSLLTRSVRESKLPSLKQAVGLLQQEGADLSRFLSEDERGQILPSYLIELADALLAERNKVSGELEVLSRRLAHINMVVATQQKYAARCDIRENVALDELLGDVEEFLGSSLARQDVEVVRDYQPVPPVNSDRQKLLQILLNIIKNGLDAIKQADRSDRGRLELRVGSRERQRAFIEVSDNGVGIPQENLIKIFSHGFTTKEHGHGFGLHSCANMVKELGGTLRVDSAGAGHGATFVLELPFGNEVQ